MPVDMRQNQDYKIIAKQQLNQTSKTKRKDASLINRILSKVQKSFWSCTHVNSCQKYTLYINLHVLLNI